MDSVEETIPVWAQKLLEDVAAIKRVTVDEGTRLRQLADKDYARHLESVTKHT